MDSLSQNFTLDKLTQRLALDKLKWPPAPARRLLAYLHSGDVLRQSLPWVLRIGAAVWLVIQVLLWIALWPAIYHEFERWGLVKAFFAQIITLLAVFLVARITMLRAGHLRALPPDDFVSLRALAVICRWLGEISLVYVLLTGLSSLLQPVSALLNPILGAVSPEAASGVSSGSAKALLVSAPLSLFFSSIVAVAFLVLYSIATAIDVGLAIEFNTRAERMSKRIS